MELNHKELKLNLWENFLEKQEGLNSQNKNTLRQIAEKCADDCTALFEMYKAYSENESMFDDKKSGIHYKYDGDACLLICDGKECTLAKDKFRKIIISGLDILEDTLPLGTVVDLRKELYKDSPDFEKIENIRMVITYRFLRPDGENYYFPYAGVVYPTGMLGSNKVYYFTRPMIKKIVHKGFSDEQEEAYVYLMKNDLIVDNGMNTYGYATKEDLERFRKFVNKTAV